MKMLEKSVGLAMAFHNSDGLPASWKFASKFAGKDGRIATAPDIIAARISTRDDQYPWNAYFTTSTAEYFGRGKNGKLILIIAHGVGPMSTIDGIHKVYSWQYKDKTRTRMGGRITKQEFLDLEEGKYGEVSIVDYEQYCTLYEYPLCGPITNSQAVNDPVLKARLGDRLEEYVSLHADYARRWQHQKAGLDPDLILPDYLRDSEVFILRAEGANNCSYGSPEHGYRKIEDGYALAHLVVIDGLSDVSGSNYRGLMSSIGLHEWTNGCRLVAIPSGIKISEGIKEGPDPWKILRRHWKDLFVETPETKEIGFRNLINMDDRWFTQYPKKGESMDTCEPEYVVVLLEEIGKPVPFKTTVGGYHGFFRYGINEITAIAPAGANSYRIVSEPKIVTAQGNPTRHVCLVQFCKIEVDTTHRLLRVEDIRHDYDVLMKFIEKD